MALRDYNVKAYLKVAGNAVPISSFQASFEPGSVGTRLDAELADPIADIPSGDVLFQLEVNSEDGSNAVTIMDIGRVMEAVSSAGWLTDVKRISAISRLADRFEVAPVKPLVLFDPNPITPITTPLGSLGEIVDTFHRFYVPFFISVPSLDLLQLLNFVYVQQLGFGSVVTNIPNFPIQRVEFPLTSSFHQVAANEIGLYEPKFHADDAGQLMITDPQGALPPGLTPRTVGTGKYSELALTKRKAKLTNAVLLSYRDTVPPGSPPFPRVEQDVTEVGTFGTPGWQRTEVIRHINDFHDNPIAPLEVTRSVVVQVISTTSALADGVVRAVQIDDQTDLFDYNFRLKRGYVKQTSIYSAAPGEDAVMRLVQTETNQIVWKCLSTSIGEFIKTFEITQVSGSVITVPDDPTDPLGPGTRTALYQANRLNDIPDDGVLEGDDPISTEITYYRVTGRDQIEVSVQRINHLSPNSPPEQAKTFQHTGTIEVRLWGQQVETNMLIVADGTADSDRRVPQRIAAGNVPYFQARPIADRILARRSREPKQLSVTLAGIDLAIRRGSLRNVIDRAGTTHTIWVSGYSITGQNLGQPDFRVEMRISGVEVTA